MFQETNLQFDVLGVGVVLYKNVIPDPQGIIDSIDSIDRRFVAGEHGNSETSVGPWTDWAYGDLVFCQKKYLPEAKDIQDWDYYATEMKSVSNALYSSLDLAAEHYKNTLYPYSGRAIKGREFEINLLRYTKGGHLPAHQDQGISSRLVSSVMYLNDDYQGGEIEFVHYGLKIKPPAGSIIFFPSNYLAVHEIAEVTSGTRYALPHWFHSREEIIESDGTE